METSEAMGCSECGRHRIARSTKEPLKRSDLPYMPVNVNLTHLDRLFDTQRAGNGVFKNSSTDAGAQDEHDKKVADAMPQPTLISHEPRRVG